MSPSHHLDAKLQRLQRQQHSQHREVLSHIAILYWRQRELRAWIATKTTSATSTPTAPTPPTSTATGASLRPAPSAVARLWQFTRTHLPKAYGWMLERALGYLWPLALAGAGAGWALASRWGEHLGVWIGGWWHWLVS